MFARESQRVEAELSQCHNQDHDCDEYLDGFIQNMAMQSWFESRGAILFCRLGLTEQNENHDHPAKCILRQLLNQNASGTYHLFFYAYADETEISLPKPYLMAKAKALNIDEHMVENFIREYHQAHTQEVVLLSFAMQAKSRGFALPLEKIDFSGPTQLIDSLISLLIEALYLLSGRAFFILEWSDNTVTMPVEAVSDAMKAVNGLLSSSRNLSHNSSVILSARERPDLLGLLGGHTSVTADSEYQGLLLYLTISCAP